MSEKNGAGKTHCQAAGEDEKQHRLTLQYQTYERLNDGPLPAEKSLIAPSAQQLQKHKGPTFTLVSDSSCKTGEPLAIRSSVAVLARERRFGRVERPNPNGKSRGR